MNAGERATFACQRLHLGTVDFQAAVELQSKLAMEIAAGKRSPVLLLLEHPPVFTLGRMAKADHLLWSKAELEQHGIQALSCDRGGDITYHGPGQLVGYPLIPLARFETQRGGIPKADYVGYIRKLERTLILALERLGVGAVTRAGYTGVWVPGDGSTAPAMKIASIGVRIDANAITRHGFALNIATTMEHWQGIVACGIDGVKMGNLSDWLDPVPSMDRVTRVIEAAFSEVFGVVWVE